MGTYAEPMIRSHTMAADAEALLWPGKKRKARVAILYPRSSFVWDQWSAAPPGSGKYPGGISDGGNKYIDGHTMDYQIDADFIYLALRWRGTLTCSGSTRGPSPPIPWRLLKL